MAMVTGATVVGVDLTRDEWVRVALELRAAAIEYSEYSLSKWAKSSHAADPHYLTLAEAAKRLCNQICDAAKLEEVFRCKI